MIKKHQKGSVLIFSLLVVSAMLAIALGLIGVFLAKLKTVGEAVNSTGAIYAADSGVEMCLYEANYKVPAGALDSGRLANGGQFSIKQLTPAEALLVPGTDCTAIATESFRVLGEYRKTNRSLEVSY